ncbi:MAG: GtrA family protein [Caulobacteraceae bacterium]|nr:GtrA family protein [Caulobacteraceae bacterium]
MAHANLSSVNAPRTGQDPHERRLLAKYAGVSLVGFAADACLLRLGTALGLEPAWARVISLSCAMQVTFLLNGLHVFRALRLALLPRQWAGYMATNAFGNFCNYWIFVTMVSTHWPVVSNHMAALATASFCAWLLNYASTRFLVFRKARALAASRRARPWVKPAP